MTVIAAEKNKQAGVAGKDVIRIMLASGSRDRLASLAAGLWTLADSEIWQTGSKEETFALLEAGRVDLAVIDEELTDASGLEVARLIARRHPFVDCILVDNAEPEAFHEKTEGLGILMQLPSPPDMGDAKSIINHLSAIRASRILA